MKATQAKRWVGFDTETFRGQVKLLAASNCHSIETPTTEAAIDFIYRQLPSIHDAGTFYNLRFDVSAILRDVAATDPTGVRSGDFIVGKYHVHHVAGKALVIGSKGGGKLSVVRVYDSAQFYPGGLDKAARTVLGIGKNAGDLGIDRIRIGNEAGYYEAHRDDILLYCIQDAKLAARLMERFQADVAETVGVYPTAWYSGASIAKSVLAETWENPFYDWPVELIDDSVAAFSGGIFDTRILGRVSNACEYDINSAYPYAISQLPEIYHPRPVNRRDPNVGFGFYLVRVKYDGLLPYRMPDRKTIIYPVSSKPLQAWLYDVELADYPDAEILRGWEFDANFLPFGETVRRLYRLRQELKADGDPREGAVKVAANSLFGAFAETKHGWTRFTNLVYAGRTAAATRHQIRSILKSAGLPPVSIATDSVTFIGSTMLEESPALGGLKKTLSGAEIVTYANGIRIIDGRVAKVRGLPRKLTEGGKERWLDARDFLTAKGDTLALTGTGPLPLLSGIVQRRQGEIASWVDIPKKVSLAPNLIRGVPDGPLTFEYLKDHRVNLSRRLVGTDPLFKRLTPSQISALEQGAYPGPFRVEELTEENDE